VLQFAVNNQINKTLAGSSSGKKTTDNLIDVVVAKKSKKAND
jgi:hypothetical protein